ncbi:MAG: hypothetical protein JSV24_05645 [Bacteroidales bacterium]|nr:MAG: hypothetical protein JSV24_05645 [Bacteroidales bacterium]
MKSFVERHIYGILGTIIVHLILAILFMLIKLSATYRIQQDAIIIDFESVPEEQEVIEVEVPDRFAEMMEDEGFWRNIAANLANPSEEEFDIEEYIEQIKNELLESGEISEDNYLDEMRRRLEESMEAGLTEFMDTTEQELTSAEMASSYSGPTRIYYNLPGRTHRLLPLPIYKCEGDGKVVLEITVDQKGIVLSAQVIEDESSTDDFCLHDMATDAASRSRFNIDLTAPSRQKGTLTYHFVAQ